MEGLAFFFAWEVALMTLIQGILDQLGAWSVSAMSAVSVLGEETLLVAIMGFAYWCYDKEAGKRLGTLIVTGLVCNPMVKNLVLRRRPYFDHSEVKCLKVVDPDYDLYDIAGQGWSFPSGHSQNAVVVYGGIPAYLKKNRITLALAVILPLLIGISRFSLGVHYPTDVFAGWILGAVLLLLIRALQQRVRRTILHVVIFLISCLGLIYCRTADYFTGIGVMAGLFLAIPFEERFVRFENTDRWLYRILRLVGGFIVYFGMNTLLKAPFSADFLGSDSMAAYIVRAVRYTIVAFAAIGVYPMIFAKIERTKP